MRGGVLPPALLFSALGLALGCASRSAWAPSLLVLLATLAAFTFLPVPLGWLEGIYLGCWISVIATAASVYLLRGPGPRLALGLALNAGVWASAVVYLSGSRLDLVEALPCVAVFLCASRVVGQHASIPVKVVSSWLIAVAVLAASLQLLSVTPGYLPDHMD